MKHTIDLSKYVLRTDLAIDDFSVNDNVQLYDDIKVTTIYLNELDAKKINKSEGNYITIEFQDVTDHDNRKHLTKIFSNMLEKLLNNLHINDNMSCLIIGLGNDKSTPDSLGPLTVDGILVTRHLFLYDVPEEGFRCVSAVSPGVTGDTGVETSDMISSVVETVKPDFIIVIDALASKSIERVNKTIQISDAGISPGSGIGNSRKEISKKNMGIPVIAIGIPTVVDAVTIVSDTIKYMHKHYAFHKNFVHNPIHNLTISNQINYLKKEVDIKEDDKKNLLGIIGTLDEEDIKQLLIEVLTPIGYNFVVMTKEVDFLINHLSNVLSNGINSALHKKIKDI